MKTAADSKLRKAIAYSGWRDLLPARSRSRVLCLDIGNGHATLALAQTCKHVVSVPMALGDAPVITDLVLHANAPNVTVVPTLQQALDDGEPFDGLVAVLFGSERSGLQAHEVQTLVSEAARHMGSGFVLLAAPNSLAYNQRRGRGDQGFKTWGAAGLQRLAASSGRVHARSWPVLLHYGAPFEVLHGSYRMTGDCARGVARLKEWLLGTTGARWFAPGYIVLGQHEAAPLAIDELLRAVDAACGGHARVRRHLTMPDKAILVNDTDPDERGHIVVLPRTPRALRRRTHEAEVLQQARNLPRRLRDLFPRFLGRGIHEGQEWLAIERMPGVFVDAPVTDLDQLTERAASVLIDLHLATRRDAQVDEALYDSLVGKLLASARGRHSGCAELLAQIDLQLRASLLGRTMPVVWMHGDYKIENVGIDPNSRQPVSIIDWELAAPQGLPLIDLKYLLVYNRMIRGRAAFDAVYRTVAEGAVWSSFETRLLDRYAQLLGLDEPLRQVLRVLFVVHAVGARLQYDMSDPQEHRQLTELLTAGRDLLAGLSSAREGGVA